MPDETNSHSEFLTHPPIPDIGFAQEVYFSSGVPTSSYYEGGYAIDTTTGDLYRYLSGAWVLQVSGGGGGATEIYPLAGSATPSATPAGGGIAYNADGDVWVWSGGVWNKVVTAS